MLIISELFSSINISDQRIAILSDNLISKNSSAELSKFDDFFYKIEENMQGK